MLSSIAIQDKVRRLEKEPREDARDEVEKLRAHLLTQFNQLDALHRDTTDIFAMDQADEAGSPYAFDDLDDDANHSSITHAAATSYAAPHAAATATTIHPPELRLLSIPSTWVNQDNPFRIVELKLRIQQASKTLQSLRDTIADKSFQYSHIIRVAPNKGVRTRARANIAKLNNSIAYLSRVYGHCRAALVKLQAGDDVLKKYQTLSKEHVKSSSALLNPNEPGSTRIQLSWIWQIGAHGAGQTTSDAMHECRCISLRIMPDPGQYQFTVNRVHWIRARGQRNRWQEEFVLTGYEMEWTVRSYMFKSMEWDKHLQSSLADGDAGAAAYAARKKDDWNLMAYKADRQFALINPSYSKYITRHPILRPLDTRV
jgi:hypothetical protein